MTATAFEMQASFDRKGRIAVAYLRVRTGQHAETREWVDGAVNADYDENGVLLGVELYGRCNREILGHLVASEPEEVRRFLVGAVPCGLIAPASSADVPKDERIDSQAFTSGQVPISWLVRFCHAIGLTNVTDAEVAEFAARSVPRQVGPELITPLLPLTNQAMSKNRRHESSFEGAGPSGTSKGFSDMPISDKRYFNTVQEAWLFTGAHVTAPIYITEHSAAPLIPSRKRDRLRTKPSRRTKKAPFTHSRPFELDDVVQELTSFSNMGGSESKSSR